MNRFNVGDKRSQNAFNGYIQIISVIEPVSPEVIADMPNPKHAIRSNEYHYLVEKHWYDGKIYGYEVYSEESLLSIYPIADVHENHPVVETA